MKRRTFLASIFAAISAAWSAKAASVFGIFQVNGPSGGGLPAGVTTQAIDGGPTYFADNSFTSAATAAQGANGGTVPIIWNGAAGWDDRHFFSIGTWLDLVASQGDADVWHDFGINTMFGQNGGSSLAVLRANSICMIQLTGQNGAGVFGGMAGTSFETVGMMSYDEPQNWAEAVIGLGGNTANFTAYMDTLNFGGALYVTSITAGNIVTHGAPITGAGVTGGTAIVGFGSGGGGVGNYSVSPGGQTVASAGSPEAMSMTLAGTPNAIQDQRFWWCNFTNAALGVAPNFCPGGSSPFAIMTTAVATPSGTGIWTTRKFNMIGMDWYPMSAGSNFNAGNTTANILGIFTPCSTSTSMTIGVPPYTTISFTLTNMPQPYLVGATAVIDGGSVGTQLGTIATFNSVTGATTMNITSVTTPVSSTSMLIQTGPTPSFTATAPTGGNFTFTVGQAIKLDAGSGNTMTGTVATFNSGTGATTATIASVTGSGTFASWKVYVPLASWLFEYSMPASQMNRPTHYGNQVDMFRTFYPSTAPCYTFIEAANPYTSSPPDAGSRAIVPFELPAMVWSTIMHRARWVVYFTNFGITSPPAGGAFFGATYGRATTRFDGTYTISNFDIQKSTHRLIQTLAPVINSPFAVAGPTQPVTVSSSFGAGYTLPFTNFSTTGGAMFNRNLDPVFEVMAHWYNYPTETINGVTLTQNRFWIWCMYRGPETDTSIVANLTLASGIVPTPASVTRIYADGVIGVPALGTTTTVQVGDTALGTGDWIKAGDTVHIVGTVGVTNLNGTYTVATVPSTTTFTINTSGSPTSGTLTTNGTVIVEHNIPVTGGTTFSDTFPRGLSVGIYRVN